MQFVVLRQKFKVVSESHWFLYRFFILSGVIALNACWYTYALDSKKVKKAHFNSILLYEPILKRWKILICFVCFVCSLGACPCQVSSHCRDFWVKNKKKVRKAHFYPRYAPWRWLPIEFKLAHGLIWLILGYFAICNAHNGQKRQFQGLSPT